jgi:hypothetical protein
MRVADAIPRRAQGTMANGPRCREALNGAPLGANPGGEGAVMATALSGTGGRRLLVGFHSGDVESHNYAVI